jgi:hypothetical protein
MLNLQHTALIDWDEGIFALQGQWLSTLGSQGKPFNFQTPPLFQVMLALIFAATGVQSTVLPLVSIVFSCLSIILVYSLGKLLYSSRIGLYAALLFASSEFFLFFSRSGLSESTFLFFFIAATFFFLRGLVHDRTVDFLYSGLFTSAALYTKYSAFPLLIIFSIIGLLARKTFDRKRFMLSVIVPVLLYMPYVILFLNVVGYSSIGARHGSLLGIHHHEFLYYLIRFAPFPLLLAFLHLARAYKRRTYDIYIIIIVSLFFVFLGFYYHYFRLAYPMVPFLAILAARSIRQQKSYVIAAIFVISLASGFDTATYKTNAPHEVGTAVRQYARDLDVRFVYASVPPNIDFHIGGDISIPETHQWYTLGEKFPVLMRGRKVLRVGNNELRHENRVLLVYATAYQSLDPWIEELLSRSQLMTDIEFTDAPMYYKDIFNPQRKIAQCYRVYLAEREAIGDTLNQFWHLGFEERFSAIVMKKKRWGLLPTE